jgi:hypothetical protein
MTTKNEIKRVRDLSGQAQQLIALKKKVAEDFDKGFLTHERLGLFTKEREGILKEVGHTVKK